MIREKRGIESKDDHMLNSFMEVMENTVSSVVESFGIVCFLLFLLNSNYEAAFELHFAEMKLLTFRLVSVDYWIEETMEYSALSLRTWDLSIGKMRVGTLISIFDAVSDIYDSCRVFMLAVCTFYVLGFNITYFVVATGYLYSKCDWICEVFLSSGIYIVDLFT